MGLVNTVLEFVGLCGHPRTYRERRDLGGVPVLHFVCDSCGHAAPAVPRTLDEHRQVVQAGALKPVVVQRQSALFARATPGRRSPEWALRPSAAGSPRPLPIERAG